MTKQRHGYVCECTRRRCRRRIRITRELYREVRGLGSIVSTECARRDLRHVVRDYARYSFAFVLTSNGGRTAS